MSKRKTFPVLPRAKKRRVCDETLPCDQPLIQESKYFSPQKDPNCQDGDEADTVSKDSLKKTIAQRTSQKNCFRYWGRKT